MTKTCRLCAKAAAREECYVRLRQEDHPACRACWEQLFLDPRRILRALDSARIDLALPPAAASN
jgi:hypothetical protein